MGFARHLLLGAAAGAAGTTALNATTYLDMALRGRGSSSTPEQTVEALANKAGLTIPGDDHHRANRVSGLGALTGLGAGVVVGGLLGATGAAGWRPRTAPLTVAATAAALVGANGPMAVLGVTDPRSWGTADWLSDLVPHLAYGLVTAATLNRLRAG